MLRKRIPKGLAIALLLVFMLCTANVAYAIEDDQLVIPDLLIGKPIGFVALGLGSLTWALTLPVTLPFGWQKKARETLVDKPYRFTFERGLGEDLNKY
jgi:hypothetical protein